jgi:hypothetical protein
MLSVVPTPLVPGLQEAAAGRHKRVDAPLQRATNGWLYPAAGARTFGPQPLPLRQSFLTPVRCTFLRAMHLSVKQEMPETEELDRLLDPAITKLNSEETYRLVPNATKIDEALGSDETGWLFDRTV